MIRSSLTVLTDPVPFGIYFPIEAVKALLRSAVRKIKPLPHYWLLRYRGHFAVTRSLVEGLRKVNANANYNPRSLAEVGETVVVLSGIAALKQAIQLKRRGQIDRLLAGPNLMVFPSEYKDLVCAPEVDWCITPCDWTNQLYAEDCPELIGRCVVWPAGVDTEYWRPDQTPRTKLIVIYVKEWLDTTAQIADYARLMHSKGYHVRIVQYGNYSQGDYRQALKEACLLVAFTRSESQGIAWAEAWSMNVPTLIFRNTVTVTRGKRFNCSTAPYLTPNTGVFFDDFEHFTTVFEAWEHNSYTFNPRLWVLENMSDEVSAKMILHLAEIV